MHWSDIEDIAEQLELAYAEEEIPEYNLPYLKEMVLSLPDFEGHEVEVSNSTLKQILEYWLDIRNEK
ncbi:Fe-S cluster assembly protein IscX [Rickettsiaceae bacterium]|nr:Fe-S cluster assembly protein IscX [Rickettsiaceae bacterium]